MLDPQLYALFLTAAAVLTLAPGPDTLFVLGASLGDGTRGGLLASAGILTGLLAHISFAVVGVSMLIAASPLAFGALAVAGRRLPRLERPSSDGCRSSCCCWA